MADDLINRILEEIGLESIAAGELDDDRSDGKYTETESFKKK